MIAEVTRKNLDAAAWVHSVSWQESHRGFCSADFVADHSPERQREYILGKMDRGSRFWLLEEGEPMGVVSVRENIIEDLYILPGYQNRGYGRALLEFAIGQCRGTPTLWILENNEKAERLYRRAGFVPSGRANRTPGKLAEIEFSLMR